VILAELLFGALVSKPVALALLIPTAIVLLAVAAGTETAQRHLPDVGRLPLVVDHGFHAVLRGARVGEPGATTSAPTRAEMLEAAQLCRIEVDANRHRMADAVNDERYWPFMLSTEQIQLKGQPLLSRPEVYRPVSDAHVLFRDWNDRTCGNDKAPSLFGTVIPPPRLAQLRKDYTTVEHALLTLDALISDLSKSDV
jgi:hypothetical protein